MLKSFTFKTLALLLVLLGGGNLVAQAGTVTDELTNTLIGVTGTSYADWSGKTSNSDAVYAGQTAGGASTNPCIQLRSKNSNSGIITTASGGKVSKITVIWNSETSTGGDRQLDIYGKNTAYSSPTQLYATVGADQGTKLGSIVCGSATELVIDGDYEFIGLRSYNGALYIDKIEVEWTTGGTVDNRIPTSVEIEADIHSFNVQDPEFDEGEAVGTLSATVMANNAAVNGATVTWEALAPGVATINADGEVFLVAAGEAKFKASYEGNSQYKPSSATYSFTVIDEDPNAAGGINNPYTVAQAVAYIGTLTGTSPNDVYVKGTISQVDSYNSNYKSITYWITDGDATMQVYSGKGLNGADFSSKDDLLVGDEVTVCGKVKMYNSTPEFDKNNYLVAFNRPTDVVAAPVFDPVGGTYYETQTVTITCSTEGAQIYYILNSDNDPNTMYNGPLTISKTTKVKAWAKKGDKTSSVTTENYIIQDPNVVMTIAEVRAQESGSVRTQGIVTTCVGTTAYIQDASAAICVYGAELDAGDEIIVSGDLDTYKGLLEIKNPVFEIVSAGNIVEPTLMTIAQIKESTNQGWLVEIEKATVTAIDGRNTTIAQGENTIVARDLISPVDYAVGDVITLTGNIGCFDGVQIANPRLQSIEIDEELSITADVTSYNVEAKGDEDLVITATVTNFSSDIDCDYVFYEADGETVASCDWMNNTTGSINTLTGIAKFGFSVEANTGAERKAYLKIKAIDGETVAFSELITIIQAVDDGQGDEETDVLTHEKIGVEGTSYASWENIKCNTSAIYAGNTAGGNGAIQMRSNNNNSGIVTTASGGALKTISVEWNSNTGEGRKLNIYGKGSPYSSASDLYDSSTQGTLLGSIDYGEGEATTLSVVDASYQYIGVRSANGALYLDKITIEWDTEATPQPSISVNPAVINVPAEGGEGSITLTLANLDDESISIEGDADWVTLVLDGNEILYYVVPNDGEERETDFIISAGEEVVVSATVTITQEAYVEPAKEYAELPFSFDGKKADIETTDGLTQFGLDNDYAASPSLKFNSSGDWVLLQFEGTPGTLSFDAKGFPSQNEWEGTFDVETSTDGENFVSLASLGVDELGDQALHTFTYDLDEDVRYIKWTLTEKGKGNVGLGKINVTEADAPIEIEVTEAGWATYKTPFALEFESGQAFVVTSATTTSVHYEEVTTVPAGTALLLKGTEGQVTTIEATVISEADEVENLLLASDGRIKGNGSTRYVLAKPEGKPVGFYRLKKDETIPSGKCYLEISEEVADGAREFLAIGDEATGINNVLMNTENGVVYDLQGRRVQQPVKGLYIQNGKKVVIK